MRRLFVALVLSASWLVAGPRATLWSQEAAAPSKADFWIESGVLKVIPTNGQPSETFTDPHPLVELTTNQKLPNWTPNFTYKGNDEQDKVHKGSTLREIASKVINRRSIWNLEFAFKPLRMIEVDIPQPSGKMQRKQLWYMVYRVKNTGYHLNFKPEFDAWNHKTYAVERINHAVHFFPHFVLQAHVPKVEVVDGKRVETYQTKEYLDRVIPAAMKAIEARERVGATLHDSVSITKVSIPVSDDKNDKSVWGVAIWEDVDPTTNFFSIFVQGLTNAYQFEDPEGAYKAGDPPGTGRKFTQKNLQLNFHRTGDAVALHEEEFSFGIPLDADPARQGEILKLYNMQAPLDYQWIYR